MSQLPGLCALAAALGAAPDSGSIQRAAETVFVDRRYEALGGSATLDEGLVQSAIRLLQRAWEWFAALLSGASELQHTNPFLYWLIIAGLVAVLALLLWHIGYSFSLAFRTSARAPEEAAEESRAARYEQFRRQAEALAASGRFAEAIRQLLFALLARAAETRAAVPPGWTNREIAVRLQQVRAIREPLLGFADTCDRLWYGRQTATADDYQRSAAVVATCVDQLEGRRSRDG